MMLLATTHPKSPIVAILKPRQQQPKLAMTSASKKWDRDSLTTRPLGFPGG